MIRAYMYALSPSVDQAEMMTMHCGASRFAYNWCLAQVRANWNQRAAEASYGIAEEDRTPWHAVSGYGLRDAWNAAKDQIAPWWRECSKEAPANGCMDLAVALRNRRTGRSRMPKFKSRRSGRLSCRFTSDVRLGSDRRHIVLPRIGAVRTCESTRKLARKVEAGIARVRSATLSWQRGRWHVSLSVDLDWTPPTPATGKRAVGVDLGIKHLAVLSTGEIIQNPARSQHEQARLRRRERRCDRRRGPDRSRGIEPSARWHKARRRARASCTRVGNLKRNDLHQLTSRLTAEYDVVVIEDLFVAALIRNRSMSRLIGQAGWGEIRRQLTYKCEWRGKTLIVADRWFASSKTCSGCGTAKVKLALSERTYVCMACGLVLDRDVNAARNLAALAGKQDTGELRREQPDGTDVRPATTGAVGPPREESLTQRRRREATAVGNSPQRQHEGSAPTRPQ